MKHLLSALLLALALCSPLLAQSCTHGSADASSAADAQDIADAFDQLIAAFYSPQSGLTTPYVAGTCEPKTLPDHPAQSTEPLIINLREVDCTTFVEYVTAARIAHLATLSADDARLQQAVEQLRYRQGRRGNYATRKHYFMEWIKEGEERGWMTDVTGQLPGAKPLARKIDFMSAHPQYYPQLADKEILSVIKQVERELSQTTVYYLPTAQIAGALSGMKHGDIVAFVTDKPGLDVQHVGFVYDPTHSGRPKLLHASSAQGQITLSTGTVADYAKGVKHVMGVRVVRVNPPPAPPVEGGE